MPGRLGKLPALTLEIGEHAVAAFLMQAVQFALEKCFEIHHLLQNLAVRFSSNAGPDVNPCELVSRPAAANGP